jgi:radical SAM superfamily enzyme YgiQ (UPF0313 family)
MKVLLTTLNAKYVHTSLALWYIYQFCRSDYPELLFREFNINQDLSWVQGEIYLERISVVAFSCNIWNIEQILIISRRLKTLVPEMQIVLGGPEVSADPESILEKNPWVDFIVTGEGEVTFKEWLSVLSRPNPDWGKIQGLAFRTPDGPVRTGKRPPIADLSMLPFPYPNDLSEFRQKLVYYETSRGCPNRCQYCLSGIEEGVRFFSMERVKLDLLSFIAAEIAQVKFVDRSFNANPGWAKEIWRFLISHPCRTNFHFEIAGDRLDDESINLLKSAPPGMFQFEIGVQSTNRETLEMIQRKMDFERLSVQVSKLLQNTPVFVHLDLIAGLPGEDYQSFGKTFNDNLLLKPDRLQLGFLKLLHGSGIRDRAGEYGYLFTEETPYEVMANHWISYDEILKLKTIEDLLERYYNSGKYKSAFRYLIPRFPTPFILFELLADWWKKQGFDQVSHKVKDQYGYLLQFYGTFQKEEAILRNLLKYDLLSNERMVELPEWAGTANPDVKSAGYQFWRDQTRRDRLVPEFDGLAIRDLQRKVLFEEFDFDPEDLLGNPLEEPVFDPKILLFVYDKNRVRVHKLNSEEFF